MVALCSWSVRLARVKLGIEVVYAGLQPSDALKREHSEYNNHKCVTLNNITKGIDSSIHAEMNNSYRTLP